jgi:hypothetical protein
LHEEFARRERGRGRGSHGTTPCVRPTITIVLIRGAASLIIMLLKNVVGATGPSHQK